MWVASACFRSAVAFDRAAEALVGPGATRRTVMLSGCSSAAWAAERSTPVSARSVTSAQPFGARNEKPWAVNAGPLAGLTPGSDEGEVVAGVPPSAAGSVAVLSA